MLYISSPLALSLATLLALTHAKECGRPSRSIALDQRPMTSGFRPPRSSNFAPASSNSARGRPSSVDSGASTTSSTAPRSSSSPSSSSSTTSPPPPSCDCGYILSTYGDAYFPYHRSINFEALPSGILSSANALNDLGLTIFDGQAMGGTGPDGTRSVCDLQNLAIDTDKALTFTVPGGQPAGGQISAAEVYSSDEFLHGVFMGSMKFDQTPGTCQSMFTYQAGTGNDEQDIEVIGQTIFDRGDNGTPAGVQLTNWDPNDSSNTVNDNVILPFPEDPTTSYHNYTIAWLPSGTKYYFDGGPLDSPTKYTSINPSKLIFNHWTNGDKGFTAGPPTQDVVFKVRALDWYYATPGQQDVLAGCTMDQACRV
ncbi:concanavalin A-like lectin/glucanase domain-containing protein [Kockovaella imperatae]|uniref:Concanavalin A-like lectin/glucanase domain-containing protein n=1 Tax=Kockovaella imperatae TaxID=4999 RepID=A0A1Y1U854_9TREE|nr:concanavalin A-like lectin/glucanase domain-containing protein [Kockovaella imperatae]ORX34192.1 concanavalin A-like lectin/glucanase domain-containing protein [Kockovaella imperatae]